MRISLPKRAASTGRSTSSSTRRRPASWARPFEEYTSAGVLAYLCERNIAVNALAPSKAVLTDGMNHPPVDQDNVEAIERTDDTAAAAIVLCTGDPAQQQAQAEAAEPEAKEEKE